MGASAKRREEAMAPKAGNRAARRGRGRVEPSKPGIVPAVDKPEDMRRYWVGRCECAACQGKPYPHTYLLVAHEHRRKDSWIVRRRNIRRGQLPVPVSYECLLQSMYGLVRRAPRVGSIDTTESGSAQGLRFLADAHAAGVAIDIHEAELEPDSDAAIEREVAMYTSLEAYLIDLKMSDDQRGERMRRCRDLCAMWPGRKNQRRLSQWLAAEFPGWLI